MKNSPVPKRSALLASATRLCVLLVEDDEDNAAVLAEVLRHLGHVVLMASSGIQAIQMLRHKTPDVVLLNLGLPDYHGYSIAGAMRTQLGNRVRLIALTGYCGSDVRDQARRAGFDSFITKPSTIDELQRQLVSTSREYALHRSGHLAAEPALSHPKEYQRTLPRRRASKPDL